MPNTAAAKKALSQSLVNRARNRAVRTRMRNALKKARVALAAGAPNAAQLTKEAAALLDWSVSKGAVKRGAADRRKSRLAKRLNATRASS